MRPMMKTMILGAVFAVGVAAAAQATPRTDARQGNQIERIQDGIAEGDLTRGEARRLLSGQRHVNRLERRTHADGVVTRGERVRLERAQDNQSGRIWRFRHNGRRH